MTAEQEKKLNELKRRIPDYEDAKRFDHTMGVYRECLWMSKIFMLSHEDAYTLCAAALLHDIAKQMTLEDALSLAKKHGKTLKTEIPSVIHQYTGAMLAQDVFDASYLNRELLLAIECHTTGKADMTDVGSTPTVSSFIKFIIGVEGGEPNRPRGLSEVRARREQRAKPILLVAKPQKAKCEDPFNANDSRHSHRLQFMS